MQMRDILRAAGRGLQAARRELISQPMPTPQGQPSGAGRAAGPPPASPPFRSQLMNFGGAQTKDSPSPGEPQSRFDDPLTRAGGTEYRERPWADAFERIRQVCYEGPYIGSIIKMRTNEVGMFAHPAKNRFETGFRVELRDPKEKITKKSLRRARELTQFVEHTGHPETSALRDRFPIYLSKITQDSLMFSQDATERVYDRQGRIAAFYAVDASTIRIAQHIDLYQSDNLDEQVRYVQVIDGLVTCQYRHKDLIFGIRNPTSDVHMNGYPVSEIELAMRAISAILSAWRTNERAITKGANIRGILNVPGSMSDEQFEAFCDNFQRFATGTENAHATNIMNCELPPQYINLATAPNEMQWGEWFNLCLRVICSIYSVAPESINFQYGNVGGGPTLNQASNEYKIIEAREKGLRPLLTHLFGGLSEGIIYPLDQNFHLVPAGLDAMTRDQLMQYNASRVQSIYTLNEIRRENDLSDLPHGDSPLNGAYMQLCNMADQKAMMQQQMQQQAQQGGQDPYADPQGGTDQAQVPDQVGDDDEGGDAGKDGQGLEAQAPQGKSPQDQGGGGKPDTQRQSQAAAQ